VTADRRDGYRSRFDRRAAGPGVRSVATSFGDPERIHSGNSYTDWLGT
jgi:hypothetical protein